MRQKFTTKELNFIRDSLEKAMTYKEIANSLQRSYNSVVCFICRNNLISGNTPRLKTTKAEEDLILQLHSQNISVTEILQRVGKSRKTIYNVINRYK